MSCASCGRANPDGARFCGGCGASLAPRCASCGADCAADARFCTACGAPIADRAPEIASARKVVTIVFADLIGSVSLHERLDAESARRFMDRYHRTMTAAVQVHGGRVIQLLGDGVLAAFGVPRVAEDDAIRAVRAAVGMQRAFRELLREQSGAGEGVGLRVAVNTGEIVVGDDASSVMGDPTNVAARLQHEARDGDVIVGEATQRLVGELVTLAPLGTFALRGRAESVTAYRVVSLERPASARATVFVGRDDELRRLLAVYDAAVAAPTARLAVLLGSPGLGKSRLVAELARRTGERATLLSARCDADGGATFAPVAAALRSFLRIEEGAGGAALRAAIDAVVPGDDAERGRIASGIEALFSGAAATPEETFFAVRRLLAALAAVRPVVLTIDDLHWAEPLLLDLVEHLVTWSAGVPLFVLVAARPELRDARSSLVSPGALVADVVSLGGLDAAASMQLAAGVVGAAELPAALVGRVLATSEGNPLFLAELVRMLVQDGILRREGERWVTTVEVSKLDMPPTIQVLLGARIERLRPEERLVLERAAVIGRQFSRSAVAELLSHGGGDLDARLEALRRSELIEPDTGWFLGEPALRFHHVLIRDAAYRRVLKETRAELHERLAGWIEARVGDAAEHEELLGFHCEQAHQNRLDLGALDAHGRALGERAARHLGAAGRRALARDDVALAASFLGRAIACLDPQDPARADLALDWCEALLSAGEVSAAAQAVTELARFAPMSDRLRAWHACFAGQLAALTDPQSLRGTAESVAAAARALAEADDAAGEAKAHSVHALVLARLGAVGACETALDLALAAARRARDRRRANAVLAGAPVAALWGPSPVTRASGRCLDVVRVLRITLGAPAVEAVALRCQAVLEALRGRGEAARRMIEASRRMVEELGLAPQILEADAFAGLIDLLEGDPDAAESRLRAAYEGLRARGLGIDAARAAALLGRALLAQGRAAEAEALSHESEALAGDDLKAAIAWRGVRAEALAGRGEHEAAIELARAAVAIASDTDALLDHADARKALTVALRAAGRTAESDAEEGRARELWEAKGATLLVERTAPAEAQAVTWIDGEASTASPIRRRVVDNAATRNAARMDAAVAARDLDAFFSVLADGATGVHHQTGTSHDERDLIPAYQVMFSNQSLRFAHEPLATLGDSLALCRSELSIESGELDGIAVGASDMSSIALLEVDERGLRTRTEFFAIDRLADAVARLYERHAELLPDDAERTRALATARTIAAHLGPFDPQPKLGALAPGVVLVDRRRVGFGTKTGPEAFLRGLETVSETGSDINVRVDEVLAASPNALLVCWTTAGTDRRHGGRFEWRFLRLFAFDADGLLDRYELFELEAMDAALARFDVLTGAPTESPFANAARRRHLELERAWEERRFDEVLASYTPDCVMEDRRALFGMTIRGRDFFANLRLLLDLPESRWQSKLLATRGERLTLTRSVFRGGRPDRGLIEAEHLVVQERDAAGLSTAIVVFDMDDLDAAHAELDARFGAGEGKPFHALLDQLAALRDAAGAPDPETAARILPADFRMRSHRRFATTGDDLDRDAYLASMGVIRDLDGRGRLRVDHVRLSSRAAILDTTWAGARDGGEVEIPAIAVLDHDGRTVHGWEMYDGDQIGNAFARYEELSRRPSAPCPAETPAQRTARGLETTATRSEAVYQAAWDARDWDGLAAHLDPAFRSVDRRPLMQLEVDRDTILRGIRPFYEAGATRTDALLATRGDRMVLSRVTLRAVDERAPSEVEFLQISETDAAGKRVLGIAFAPDQLDAAYAELDALYHAGEAAPNASVAAGMLEFRRAFVARDWDALAARCADDIEVHDRRRMGWEPLHGPAAYVDALRALVELAPDTSLRLDHVEIRERGYLVLTVWTGTREGGAFEEPSWMVAELDAKGRIRRFDQYDLDRLDAASARFESLGRTRDPFVIPPNAAVRAMERFDALARKRDFDALAELFAPAFAFEDRRPGMRDVGDRAKMLASIRFAASGGLAAPGAATLETLATAGDRLALFRMTFRGLDGPRVLWEIDTLQLAEVDAAGRIVAQLTFAPDARREAAVEMFERFWRTEQGLRMPPALIAATRATLAHDMAALRAALPDDFEFADFRHSGLGAGGGPEDNVAWMRTAIEQSDDLAIEVLHYLAIEDHGTLSLARAFGTLRDGGAFESPVLRLQRFAGARWIGVEVFEPQDVERAKARFEELRPDPTRLPHNAAARFFDRLVPAFAARDWDAWRVATSPDFRFEDRRRRALVVGNVETWIRNLEVVSEWSVGVRRFTPIAALGERIVLTMVEYASDASGPAFEGRFLRLTELDENENARAIVCFDSDDRPAAFLEAYRRFAAGEGGDTPAQRAMSEIGSALHARDWEALRASLAETTVIRDHRAIVGTAIGDLDRDAWIGMLRVSEELAPEYATEAFRFPAWSRRGRVWAARTVGRTRDGGPFEYLFVGLFQTDGERLTHLELFDVGDLDRALARFAELSEDGDAPRRA